jgi:hypothetical protein
MKRGASSGSACAPVRGCRRRRQSDRALTSIEAYPFWAVVIVGIDVLVIYGLAAYGHHSSGRPA